MEDGSWFLLCLSLLSLTLQKSLKVQRNRANLLVSARENAREVVLRFSQIYQFDFILLQHLFLHASWMFACHCHGMSSPQAKTQLSISLEKSQVHSPDRVMVKFDHGQFGHLGD